MPKQHESSGGREGENRVWSPSFQKTALGEWRRFVEGEAIAYFQTELGLADPAVANHLASLLVRSLTPDGVLPEDPITGKRLRSPRAVSLRLKSERCDSGDLARLYESIGDLALFLCGAGRTMNSSDRHGSQRFGEWPTNLGDLGLQGFGRAVILTPENQAERLELRKALASEFKFYVDAVKQAHRNLIAFHAPQLGANRGNGH